MADSNTVRDLIIEKTRACHATVCLLLQQLADLPGASTVSNDGRDLSRNLNEAVKNAEFMERWVQLAEKYHMQPPPETFTPCTKAP